MKLSNRKDKKYGFVINYRYKEFIPIKRNSKYWEKFIELIAERGSLSQEIVEAVEISKKCSNILIMIRDALFIKKVNMLLQKFLKIMVPIPKSIRI